MIDWKAVEAALCLKGIRVCKLTGFSPSYWSEVKNGKRCLSPEKEMHLIIQLINLFNINNQAQAMKEMLNAIRAVRDELAHKFPTRKEY